MAILSIAGVSLPVLIDSFMIGTERVGSIGRGVNGWTALERRKEKAVYEFALAPKSLDEAQLYRMLLLGEGEFWNCQTSIYGARGYAITGTGAINGADNSPNPVTYVGQGAWKMTTSQTMILPTGFYDQSAFVPSSLNGPGTWPLGSGQGGYTAIGWRYNATGPDWRIFAVSGGRKDAAPTNKRERVGALRSSGAAQAYSGSDTWASSTTALTITAPGTGGPYYFSNVLVLPWLLGDAALDLLMAGWAANEQCLPALPRLQVSTDLLPVAQQNASNNIHYQSTMIMTGELISAQLQPHWLSGAFTKTAMALSGRLTEV